MVYQSREFRGKTDKEIGLWATRADILGAYGDPDRETKLIAINGDTGQETFTGQTRIDYDKLGLSFTFDLNGVHHISINALLPKPALEK